MVKRKPSDTPTSRDADDSSGEPIGIEKPINSWDTLEERAEQQRQYYTNIERVVVKQIVKELNAMLAIARIKPDKLCQLDRQALTAKCHLILSKIEASKVAENQLRMINTQVARARHLLT